ncbi:MAG TPA: helix-turn-helix transcriptional regulator [Candidatus Sulfotelmatobacter sp.]|jgi:phage repressor protein C with HTH and peptisase S24 domain|nr:helix-turn-helix transcriptional regulator [Candidatus Sulfotelmatobacter sp.]
MLKHADIWSAIDRLAQENGLTASGLARRAGLDPTTFNRSKRMTREGKPRWPSTESISKILDATGVRLAHFVSLVRPDERIEDQMTVPLASLNDLRGGKGFDDSGLPRLGDWDEIPAPDVADPKAFAIEINGGEYEPVYRDGDILIVSPSALPRRGDRVMVRTVDGQVMIRRLLRQTAKRVDLLPLSGEDELSLTAEEIASVIRVVWSSQ